MAPWLLKCLDIQVRQSKASSDPETPSSDQSGTLAAKNRDLKATPAMPLIARTQSPLNVDVTIANPRHQLRLFKGLDYASPSNHRPDPYGIDLLLGN